KTVVEGGRESRIDLDLAAECVEGHLTLEPGMEAVRKDCDPFALMTLTGEKLLLLRIRLGGEVKEIVEAELDRRSGVGRSRRAPGVATASHRKRRRGLSAA